MSDLEEEGLTVLSSEDTSALRSFVEVNGDLATRLLLTACNTRPISSEAIAVLVESGADVNGKKENGTVPLHGLASFNAVAEAKYLIDKGADVNVPGGGHFDSGTPLDFAAGFAFPRLVDLFVEHGAIIYNLSLAASAGDAERVRGYFTVDGRVFRRAESASPTEVERGDALLDDPRECLQRAFMRACLHGRIEVVKILIEHGINVNDSIGLEYHGQEWDHLEKENRFQTISGPILKHVQLRGFQEIAGLLQSHGASLS